VFLKKCLYNHSTVSDLKFLYYKVTLSLEVLNGIFILS
jgi:hypothetical protein